MDLDDGIFDCGVFEDSIGCECDDVESGLVTNRVKRIVRQMQRLNEKIEAIKPKQIDDPNVITLVKEGDVWT